MTRGRLFNEWQSELPTSSSDRDKSWSNTTAGRRMGRARAQTRAGSGRVGSGLLHLFVSKPSGNRWREEGTQSGGRWKTRKLPADSRRRDDVIRNTMLFCSDPEHRHAAGSLTYCLLFHFYKTVLLFITSLFQHSGCSKEKERGSQLLHWQNSAQVNTGPWLAPEKLWCHKIT